MLEGIPQLILHNFVTFLGGLFYSPTANVEQVVTTLYMPPVFEKIISAVLFLRYLAVAVAPI